MPVPPPVTVPSDSARVTRKARRDPRRRLVHQLEYEEDDDASLQPMPIPSLLPMLLENIASVSVSSPLASPPMSPMLEPSRSPPTMSPNSKPINKERRNASFLTSNGASLLDAEFEGGGANRGVTFFTRQKFLARQQQQLLANNSSNDSSKFVDEEKHISPISLDSPSSSPSSRRPRSKHVSLAAAFDPSVLPATTESMASLAQLTRHLKDAQLRKIVEEQREEEERRWIEQKKAQARAADHRHHHHHDIESERDATSTTPVPAGATAAAPPDDSTSTNAAQSDSSLHSTSIASPRSEARSEVEQQVLDEWTSSDEEDAHIPEDFKTDIRLSRTTRRKWGLKSMREVMNLLSKPLAKRDDPLREYEQSGAFQSCSYWPAEGRFAKMKLIDGKPTHSNLHLINPTARFETGDRILRETLEPYLKSSSDAAADAHAPTVSEQQQESTVSPQASNDSTLSSSTQPPSLVEPSTTAVAAAVASASPSPLSSELSHAFAMLDPSVFNQTESESLAIFLHNSSKHKKQQALALYAAAQAAPFVQLRRDLEDSSHQKRQDAFQRYLASDQPLLTDQQIDDLLASKIDESVRKGFPRNRAELRGLSTKGAVSFGIPRALIGRQTGAEREYDALTEHQGGRANGLQEMFHDARGAKAKHRIREMIGLKRPYSANDVLRRTQTKQVEQAHASVKTFLHDPPPVGTYHPSHAASDTTIHAPDLISQSGRDRMPVGVTGLGAAVHALKGSNLSNLKRDSLQVPELGPGPADTHVARWLDHDDTALKRVSHSMTPGPTFLQGDIGQRTAIMTETGHAQHIDVVRRVSSKTMTEARFHSIALMKGRELYHPSTGPPPMRMSKVTTSIGDGPKLTFATAELSARTSDGVARQDTATTLQHADTSTMGPKAHIVSTNTNSKDEALDAT